MFLNCSTSFGRHTAHHQELKNLVFCCRPLRWLSHRSGNRQPKTYVKPEAAITVFELLMIGGVPPETCWAINPLNPELNPICYLLALLGAHHFLHVSRIRVKSLTFRRLMPYIYWAPILDISRSHTTTQQASGLRPLACWDLGFESHRGHEYLSVVGVVCCQVEVSATSWSLVQRSPTDCSASLCVI